MPFCFRQLAGTSRASKERNQRWTIYFSKKEGCNLQKCIPVDKDKCKGALQIGMSQRITPKDVTKTAPSSSCAKHLEFARLKAETGKKCYFPLNVDKKRGQNPITALPRSKHCEKSTSRKFQELKVYQSFMGEEETDDKGSNKRSSSKTSQYKSPPVNAVSFNAESTSKAKETSLMTPCKHQEIAIRRYALYRGMLKQ